MKKNILSRSLIIIMMIAAMSMTTNVWAQGRGAAKGQGGKKGAPAMQMKKMLPDLTDDQVKKIKSLRMEMMKKITPMKAELQELKAHLHTLSIAEKVDMEAINKTIDRMGAIRTKMMMIRAKFQQDVRAVLNEEQRIIFDSKADNMMGHGMKGHHGSKQGKPCRGM
jgi:Spy/CpxP family protein refolding chaperone